MLAGFDELTLSCSDEASRDHIREAIRCYESGAYRSAIVATYISVCFDLIEKIRILSAAGDGNATNLLSDLTELQTQRDNGNLKAIPGLLQFERTLLEEFRDKFDFFGVNEFDDLARLREDRNRCAHPTFFKSNLPYAPSAELARLHIRNALIHVLTQEPRQGKAALANLEAVVLSAHFPGDVSAAVLRLKGAGLSNARDALTRGFIDALMFGLPDSSSPYYSKQPAMIALEAAIEINRPVALPRAIADVSKLLLRTEPDAIKVGASVALLITEIGEDLDEVSKGVIRTWIQKEDSEYLGNVIKRALKMPWCKDDAIARIPTLTAAQIGNLKGEVPPEIVSRAAELYASASNWIDANNLASTCALPFADRFSTDDLKIVFGNASGGKADLLGSHGFKDLITSLYEKNPAGQAGIDALLDEHGLDYYKH